MSDQPAAATSESDSQRRQDRMLILFLRIVGLADLGAMIAVFLPDSVMAGVHEAIGLGEFPKAAIVSYLARSTSLLYAMHGAVLLFLSTDVVRYRPVIRFLGGVIAAAGILLGCVDIYCSLPIWWIAFETVTVVLLGVAMMWLTKAASSQ